VWNTPEKAQEHPTHHGVILSAEMLRLREESVFGTIDLDQNNQEGVLWQ
jgi:hypothetical protein